MSGKKLYFFVAFVVVVGVFATLRMISASLAEAEEEAAVQPISASNQDEENRVQRKIGGREEEEPALLDAGKLPDLSYDPSYQNVIKDILEQKGKYKNQYKQLVNGIRSLTEDTDTMFDISGCKEVYVSEIPVFGFDAFEGKVNYQTPQIMIFSKDYKKMAVCRFGWEDNSFQVADFGNADDALKEIVSGDGKDSIISIYGHYSEYWLTSDNRIHYQPNPMEIEIQGDVYDKLSHSEIAISKEKIQNGGKIEISFE